MVHEWALAEAIANYVSNYMEARKASRVKKLSILLGELQSIDREILDFALKEILKSRGITVESLEYVVEKVVFRCRRCGYKWSLGDTGLSEEVKEAIHFVPEVVHSYFKCPRCGSRDFEIVSGRGLAIKEIEVA